MRDYLRQTGDKDMIVASPRDRNWGIGIGLKDEALLDQSKWGKNKLGTLLMKVGPYGIN